MRLKRLLKFYVTVGCFFIWYAGYSQTIIPRFEQLGVNDGLPHSSVYSITQDKKGFMWFGTPDGLCRYDGSALLGFKYVARDSNDIINNFVRGRILEDPAGNMWYSNESGIYKWDVYKEIIVKVRSFNKNEFGNISFQTVALDNNGSLWLLNIGHGVFEFNISSGKLTGYPMPASSAYATVLLSYNTVDGSGNIWIRLNSTNDPILVFDKATHSYSARAATVQPHAVFFGKESEVYAFEDRLVYKNRENGQVHSVMKMINDKKISFYSFDGIWDSYGRLWMTARGNGLFYYDEVNDRFQQYHHDNSKIKSLPFDLTTCLFIDRSQNLWIGIDGGGVAKLDLKQPKFNLFPLSEGDYPVLRDYFTKCFYEDDKGRTWFGSHNNGLNILEHTTGKLINYHYDKTKPDGIPGNIVGSIIKDKEGRMWVGSSGGISMFNEKTGRFKTVVIQQLPAIHPDMNVFVYKMIQLKNGDFLAATLFGLVRISKQPNGSYEGYYFKNISYLISTATDVVELPSGTVYASIPGLGLYELQPDGIAYKLSNIFLKGLDLRSIRTDETNSKYLWVASAIGLIHFNILSKTYSLCNEKNGLANSYVYGSLEDEKNNLWISTNGGLSYLDRATDQIVNYSFQDGLQSNEFNTQAFYKSSSNTFYFGGIKGFNWFRSNNFIADKHKPQAAITQIEVENILSRSYGQLPYDSNDVNFKFAALDYTRPEANVIQYKLEGWDKKWIYTYVKSARYSHLPPGKYTMIMKASNAAGIWSEEKRVSIEITPPFWKSWWFYLLEALVISGALILITRSVMNRKLKIEIEKLVRLKALEDERYRISQEMHDDIGAGLTQISLISESAKSHPDSGQVIRTELEDISVTSRQLVDNISEIIWALNPKHDKLDTLLPHLREQLNKLLEYTELNFTIDFPVNIPSIELNNQQRRNILMITKEVVHNVVKHSSAHTLTIMARLNDHKLQFIIKDDGKGFDQTTCNNGNGLKNIRNRVEEMRGSLEITNENGKGTVFIYSLNV